MITTWQDYVTATSETAQYPGVGTGGARELSYLVLGLIGEVGEVLQSHERGDILEERCAEIGDCFWYLGRLESLAGRDLFEHCRIIWQHSKSEQYCLSRLEFFAMRLANHAKKVLRDGADIEKTTNTLMLVTTYLVSYALITINADGTQDSERVLSEHVWGPNIEKLRSRKARGTIGGDGDKR